jgi:hypothetical protein
MRKINKFLLISFVPILFVNCSSKKGFDIDKVLQNPNQEESIFEIDSLLNVKCDYGAKIERLNASQKTFLLIENLEREVNNGGFDQFYFNSSGDFANETISALEEIGAYKTAEIVRTANSELKNGNVPKNQTERQKQQEIIRENAIETWNKCDEQFYRYEEDLSSLLIKFVRNHKQDFKK